MSTLSAAVRRIGLFSVALPPGTLGAIGILGFLVLLAVAGARVSETLFYAAAVGILITLAFLSYRLPRIMLVAVIFTPIVDRYLVSLLVPATFHGVTNYLSEALLVVVAASIGLRAWRTQRLVPSLRHPVVALMAAFALLSGLSAAVNGVPAIVALAGIAFTLDAVVLFVLPRQVRVDVSYARVALVGFSAMGTVAAVLALGQVLLHADFLGMASFTGRFSEGRRVAAFLVNPNMLGVILAMAIPLPLMATVRVGERRHRVLAGAATFLMALALLYTFSRGAWLGLGVAGATIGLLLDRRALLALLLFAALAYGSATVLPRHVLQPEAGDAGFDLGAATIGRLDVIGEGTDARVQYVANALPIIADHPLLGAGPGRYGGAVAWRFGSPLYDQYTAGSVPRDRTVDNFWLHLVTESGVLGTLLFVGALAAGLREVVAAARAAEGWPRMLMGSAAAIAIVVAVDSLTEMLLEGNTTSFAVWFCLGVASALAIAGRRAARAAGSTVGDGEVRATS